MSQQTSLTLLVADEIRAEVKHMRVGESILNEIHKRFKENKVSAIFIYSRLIKNLPAQIYPSPVHATHVLHACITVCEFEQCSRNLFPMIYNSYKIMHGKFLFTGVFNMLPTQHNEFYVLLMFVCLF